jgi:hypothetical protein
MTGSLGDKKFVIDGVQQPTINLVRGGLYVFDVSDSSNTDQTLRFSTTSNGTHAGGTIYTTGVSQNLGGGNPGAKIEFQVASDAPSSLHYFDVNAGTNAGGEINTLLGSTYGTPPWNVNSWGSDEFIVSLSGLSATSNVGNIAASNLEGWGRQAYGNSGWGVEYSVAPSGLSATTSLGSVVAAQFIIPNITGIEATASLGDLSINTVVEVTGVSATVSLGDAEEFNETGWGRLSWGQADWGEGADETVAVTGLSSTTSIGSISTELTYLISLGTRPQDGMLINYGDVNVVTEEVAEISGVQADFATPVLDYAGTLVGWGRDEWGENAWGDSPNKIVNPVGLQATSSVGTSVQEFAYELSGQSVTSSLGDIDFVISPTQSLDGQESSSTLGTLGLEFGPASISGVSSTTSVGTLGLEFGPADITGVSSTISTGDLTIDDSQIVNLTGVSTTSSVGSIVYEIAQTISGQSATSANGSFDITDIVQGLSLNQITSSEGLIGILAYKDVPTGSNTSYTNVSTGSNSSITAVDTGSNTSYNPVSTGSNTSISDVATGSNTSYTDVA